MTGFRRHSCERVEKRDARGERKVLRTEFFDVVRSGKNALSLEKRSVDNGVSWVLGGMGKTF